MGKGRVQRSVSWTMAAAEYRVVERSELFDFCVRCLEAAGAKRSHAQVLADVIVTADYRGHYSHGLNRLEFYVDDIMNAIELRDKEPTVVKETAATALVDGNNTVGPVVGQFAMDLAIKKAKEVGIGWVSATGSNHFGIAGWYSIRAMEQGMLGMAFTNSSPMLVPTRAKEKTLGTNPISLAAPGNNGDSFVLDMATTSVALGKVEMKNRLCQELPFGWGVDSEGRPSTDTEVVLHEGGLLPLGGLEETSGFKGYGLAMMVDVFCGILSGSAFGPFVRHWSKHKKTANLGQCFVAINPGAFADGFTDRMSQLIDHCRNLEPADGDTEVLVPGDPERKHMERCQKLGGIPYHENQMTFADGVAQKCRVALLKRVD